MQDKIKPIIEALLLATDEPMSVDKLLKIFEEDSDAPDRDSVKAALKALQEDSQDRGVDLVEVASGWQYRVKVEYSQWLKKLWQERPPRYSRALLETLALVAYRQPITRAEVEEVRGVVVSTNIMRTLMEREWVRIVGFKDVPGKPAMYATTKAFLDYFNLKTLNELPALAEIADLESAGEQLEMEIQAKTQVEAEQEAQIEDEVEIEE